MGRFRDRLAAEFARMVKKKHADARVLLFGSRARGDELKESDYDFIIVSNDFKHVPFLERMAEFQSLWKARPLLETLCYTPEEFAQKKRQIGIVSTALNDAIQLA